MVVEFPILILQLTSENLTQAVIQLVEPPHEGAGERQPGTVIDDGQLLVQPQGTLETVEGLSVSLLLEQL